MYLHEELRKAREEAGLTQAQLARLADIPRNQVVRAEQGGNITLDTLRKIVAQLPVTSLTLMENVQLTADLLPAPQKIYLGAMATLGHMTEALGAAVGMAMAARAAMEKAKRNEPLLAELGIDPDDGEEDDLLLLKSMEAWYRHLERTIHDAAWREDPAVRGQGPKIDSEGPKTDSEGPKTDSEGSKTDSEGSKI